MSPRAPTCLYGALLLLGHLVLAPGLRAQEGQDLTQAPFNIDVVTGPVLGSHAAIGMGGARTALAAGVDGGATNPAAYASRSLWDLDWFEWDWSVDLIPGTLYNTDFDNNGQIGFTYNSFVFLTLGLGFCFGNLGLGGLLRFQTYNIGNNTDLTLLIGNYAIGYTFFDGDLVVGAGARTAQLVITTGNTDSLVDFAGTAPEGGAIYRPTWAPMRIGLAARMPVVSTSLGNATVDENGQVAGLTLPQEVQLPWEVQAGIAWQFGDRPLNRRWVNPHDVRDELAAELEARQRAREHAQWQRERSPTATEGDEADWEGDDLEPPREGEPTGRPRDRGFWNRERMRRRQEREALQQKLLDLAAEREREFDRLSRRYVLVSADVIAIGPSDNAVGFESFLQQVRQTSGKNLSVGVRAGMTTEPIANRLKARLGGYLEPSRFAGVGYRPHATIGSELRLFRWDLFGILDPFDLRLGLTFDFAERYLNWAFGIGTWH